jgi:hypothetical protein
VHLKPPELDVNERFSEGKGYRETQQIAKSCLAILGT